MIILKFETPSIFNKAVDLIKDTMSKLRSDKFNFNYQKKDNTIHVTETNAPIIESLLKKNNINDFELNRGYGNFTNTQKVGSNMKITFKFTDKVHFKSAVDSLNKAIKVMKSGKFDFNYIPEKMTITIDKKNENFIKDWFDINDIKGYDIFKQQAPVLSSITEKLDKIASEIEITNPEIALYIDRISDKLEGK